MTAKKDEQINERKDAQLCQQGPDFRKIKSSIYASKSKKQRFFPKKCYIQLWKSFRKDSVINLWDGRHTAQGSAESALLTTLLYYY